MKLAEALRERKQLQIKMGTLRQKLIDNAIYQEGSKPVEDPAELIKALAWRFGCRSRHQNHGSYSSE